MASISIPVEERSAEPMSLEGKRILITGGSSGIGRACAVLLSSETESITVVGRDADELEKTSTLMVKQSGYEGHLIAADITTAEGIELIEPYAAEADILINNAGVAEHAPFLEANPETLSRVFDTNVVALLSLSQIAAKGMVDRRGGHIINISSVLARTVYPFSLVYAASKHAVAAICKGLRIELAEHGIKVTEIAPGLVKDTKFARYTTHPAVLSALKQRSYEGVSPYEVAVAVQFALTAPGNAEVSFLEVKPREQGI